MNDTSDQGNRNDISRKRVLKQTASVGMLLLLGPVAAAVVEGTLLIDYEKFIRTILYAL